MHFGQLLRLCQGQWATVLAIGPTLDRVLAAVADLDVTVLYLHNGSTIRPSWPAMVTGEAIILVEPGYADALLPDVCSF